MKDVLASYHFWWFWTNEFEHTNPSHFPKKKMPRLRHIFSEKIRSAGGELSRRHPDFVGIPPGKTFGFSQPFLNK